MKQGLNPQRKTPIVTILFVCLFAAACSKDNDEQIDTVEITPVPTQAAEGTPAPPTDLGMPLSPMEVWCESMMTKPDQEWTREEADKFSQQCLYNE